MFCNLLRFAAVALALATVAPHSVQAACSFGKCNNAVWAPERSEPSRISGGPI